MPSLTNEIQQYIKHLLDNSSSGYIEIQRNRLAEKFLCVPSQINYVLGTRFTVKQGYIVESRQGGGGYLRIIKLPLLNEEKLCGMIDIHLKDDISEQAGIDLLKRLHEEGLLTKRERMLMENIIKKETLNIPERNMLRSRILQSMLFTLLRKDFKAST